MNVFALRSGRYALCVEVLSDVMPGSTNSPQEHDRFVDGVIGKLFMRDFCRHREYQCLRSGNRIALIQASAGWGHWAFSDMFDFARVGWCALASHGIPSRGTIAFGEFVIPSQVTNEGLVSGGRLSEVFAAISRTPCSQWLGVTMLPDAWKAVDYMEKNSITCGSSEGAWYPESDCLRVNPAWNLIGAYQDFQLGQIEGDILAWYAPYTSNAMYALDNLVRAAELCATQGKSTEPAASTYCLTAERIGSMLGSDCVEWALATVARNRESHSPQGE